MICEIALAICLFALLPARCREILQLFWRGSGAAEEARLSTDPLDVKISDLPRQGLGNRVDEWSAETRRGRTGLGFDDWLEGIALPVAAARAGMRILRDDLRFVICHGARYTISDSVRGARVFECRIDGRFPVVAFIDDQGRRGPWVTIPKLFTIEEIVGMTPQP
ncbi:hypothetical protein LMG32289_06255 [Cupriavidus pampae]|uniref:Uncharacterized protein n=1 Tax=Cupriavidus pampae TaxID=659251 RepID=A0ABM8Y0A4_9BURK|nr:hypothetical protein LMG32289_06255 [Cupriavidus pampae]